MQNQAKKNDGTPGLSSKKQSVQYCAYLGLENKQEPESKVSGEKRVLIDT